jgi:hypothetical protein
MRKLNVTIWPLKCGQESFINQVPCHEGELETGGIVPCILDLGYTKG